MEGQENMERLCCLSLVGNEQKIPRIEGLVISQTG